VSLRIELLLLINLSFIFTCRVLSLVRTMPKMGIVDMELLANMITQLVH
jgi:hypothetical protein